MTGQRPARVLASEYVRPVSAHTVKRAPKDRTKAEREAWLVDQLAKGAPVLAEFRSIDHFSVCVGRTKARWIVFDTSGRRTAIGQPDGRMIAFQTDT